MKNVFVFALGMAFAHACLYAGWQLQMNAFQKCVKIQKVSPGEVADCSRDTYPWQDWAGRSLEKNFAQWVIEDLFGYQP